MTSSEATRLIEALQDGDPAAAPRLFEVVYAELRRLAADLMRAQRDDHTLQPTALVHEAFVKLVDRERAAGWNDRQHFVRVAARAMRNVLVDHARSRGARKRDGGARADLDGVDAGALLDDGAGELEELLTLDEVLSRLEELDPELARVVELRFFGGLSIEDTAAALELSTATVERRWRVARMWLKTELGAG